MSNYNFTPTLNGLNNIDADYINTSSIISSSITGNLTYFLLLDSNNTSSYDGSQFNALYYIDLTKILTKQEDFNKSYVMYCSFRSRSDIIANNQITNNDVYLLTVDLFKGLNIYQYNNRSGNPVFIVPVSYSSETATPQTFFDLKDYDSRPVLIPDLNNISKIYLNLSLASTNSTFSPTVNAFSRYVCMLTFIEC